jgi:L-threonylcarbamoyladenylate synthase
MRARRKTRLLAVAPAAPDRQAIREAAQVLRAGGLVVLPTDTVYGLCCDASNEQAIALVYRAKGRPLHLPLVVFVKGAADLQALGVSMPQAGRKAVEHFWPGPLTAIFSRPARPRGKGDKPALPDILSAGGETIGFRAPNHIVAQSILEESGLYIASTSANLSGQPSAKTAREAFEALQGRVHLVIDSGPAPLGRESTVVDFTASPPRILRPGAIPEQEILRAL